MDGQTDGFIHSFIHSREQDNASINDPEQEASLLIIMLVFVKHFIFITLRDTKESKTLFLKYLQF